MQTQTMQTQHIVKRQPREAPQNAATPEGAQQKVGTRSAAKPKAFEASKLITGKDQRK